MKIIVTIDPIEIEVDEDEYFGHLSMDTREEVIGIIDNCWERLHDKDEDVEGICKKNLGVLRLSDR